MNLLVASNDLCLDPQVWGVKTSDPAAQFLINSQQRTVRQSMMSGPHYRGVPDFALLNTCRTLRQRMFGRLG